MSSDMPHVVNPDKGYLVNCNNYIASSRMKHGVTHGWSFVHRKVRISEMIEDFMKNGRKIKEEDLKKITFDIEDI